MSASASKDRRPGASAPGVRSFRWTRETRMSSGPRRCVGGCRELRRRPPERPGRCAKGRRSTRRRGAPPTAPLGPRGASAGCGDGPAACRGTPRCGGPWPASHRATAAGPAARPPLGRHLPRLLAVAWPGARGGPGPAEPVRRLDRRPGPAARLRLRLVVGPGGRARPGLLRNRLGPAVALGRPAVRRGDQSPVLPVLRRPAAGPGGGAGAAPRRPEPTRPALVVAADPADGGLGGRIACLADGGGALISVAPAPVALVAAAVAGALNA